MFKFFKRDVPQRIIRAYELESGDRFMYNEVLVKVGLIEDHGSTMLVVVHDPSSESPVSSMEVVELRKEMYICITQ